MGNKLCPLENTDFLYKCKIKRKDFALNMQLDKSGSGNPPSTSNTSNKRTSSSAGSERKGKEVRLHPPLQRRNTLFRTTSRTYV